MMHHWMTEPVRALPRKRKEKERRKTCSRFHSKSEKILQRAWRATGRRSLYESVKWEKQNACTRSYLMLRFENRGWSRGWAEHVTDQYSDRYSNFWPYRPSKPGNTRGILSQLADARALLREKSWNVREKMYEMAFSGYSFFQFRLDGLKMWCNINC